MTAFVIREQLQFYTIFTCTYVHLTIFQWHFCNPFLIFVTFYTYTSYIATSVLVKVLYNPSTPKL